MSRAFDWPRISRAMRSLQTAIRCTTDGDDATVCGPALQELLDALGAELRQDEDET